MPGPYRRARRGHVGRPAHLGYRIRLTDGALSSAGCRRITPRDDGIRAGQDDNGQVAEERTSGRPGWLRRTAGFLGEAEDRPVVSAAARAADAAIAVVATMATMLAVIQQARTGGSDVVFPIKQGTEAIRITAAPGSTPSPGILLRAALTTAPLAFRRTYPLAAFGVMLGTIVTTNGYTTWITFAAVIFAAYSAVAYSAYRRLALLGVLAGALVVTAAYPNTTPQVPERFTAVLVLLPTVSVGMAIRVWRNRARESAERLRQAEAGHEAEKRRAVEQERARIASEMHDVVTHNVSVMVVQAGAARRVLDSSPEDAREALLAVEASGRTAMAELRHLLGLLAPSGEGEPGAAAPEAGCDEHDAALAPQPGVAQIPALLARLCGAGMPVELAVDEPALTERALTERSDRAGLTERTVTERALTERTVTERALTPGVDLAAFRVVQEGLTNVMKHAGPARTTVRLEYRPRDLLITVSDDGPPPGSGPRDTDGLVPGPVPGGRGLIGLRERIAVYGGELDAGPRPGGGWRLTARIPLDPAAGQLAVPPEFLGAST